VGGSGSAPFAFGDVCARVYVHMTQMVVHMRVGFVLSVFGGVGVCFICIILRNFKMPSSAFAL
jgi:hypothetical protein